MKKLWLWIVLVLLIAVILICALALPAEGQELPSAPQPRTFDKRFAVVSTLTIGAAALDAWSTNRNLERGYLETNPILGPRPAPGNVWALCLGESAGWSAAGYFVKRATRNSKSHLVRNLWLALPGLSFAGHSRGWLHNVSIYDPIKYPKVKP